MDTTSRFVWMNGRLVPFSRATVHFLTPALHYGLAVFEGIRAYEGIDAAAVFRLHEHARRLLESAKILGFRELPWTVRDVENAVLETVASNGFAACYVRPLLYLEGGGWNMCIDGGRPSLSIAAWEWPDYLGREAREHGIRVNVSSFTRHHPNATMTKAKSAGNYVNGMLAKTESVRAGFDEAVMLDPDGYVAECTGQNLFLVRNGTLWTSEVAAILEGITRDTLITLAREADIPVRETRISRDQLYVADEVFLCGTAAECVAVREVDGRMIGSGRPGPVTRALQRAFDDVVRGRHSRSAAWLTPVARVPVCDQRPQTVAEASGGP